jgi:3-phenylpropionate/cinnamic acid dioxygenase small subunit
MSGLEDRLRALEDKEEIRRLFLAYATALDARDMGAYSALFAREGEWRGGTGWARTPDGIRAMLDERLGPNPPAPGPTHRHLVTNERIELDGDSATAVTTWTLASRTEDDVPELTLLGHYHDTLVREDGRWRFASREAHIDIPARPMAPKPD